MPIDVVAIIATYNEERFLPHCIEHYRNQGVDAYIIDNESTDSTREIAESYLGCGVIGIDTLERHGRFSLTDQMRAKEDVARRLDADWLIHADADEIRLAPTSDQTLVEALAEVDAQGYSLVNFLEFTFVPTAEHPDHDHDRFLDTMRWYYHFGRWHPKHLKAWKASAFPEVQLAATAGHKIEHTPDQLFPIDFKFRHYMCLSRDHIRRKYLDKTFSKEELAQGWHGFRAAMTEADVVLPSEADLKPYLGDDLLDTSDPVTTHHLIYQPSP